jgi:RND family efflux transporter MFP subunit
MGAAIGIGAALLMASPPAGAEDDTKADDASVLVATQPAQRGEIAERLIAYGSAAPAVNASMTLSVPAEGRVMRIFVTPGEAVHAGQALLEFHLSAAASSTYAQAQSALKLAREEQLRTARLLAQQLATREQQAQADKAVNDAQAALAALEHETGGKPQQTLAAPFDGVVAAVPVAQGDRVAAGAALVALTRSNGLIVTVGIEPADVKKLRLQQSAQVEPLTGGADKLAGKLVRIDRSLNPKTRLVDADIAVEGDLLQGEAFRAGIETGRIKGWLVPRDAVLDDDDGAYLFQIDGSKAVRVKVKRIGSDDQTTVVDGPLDARREVVVVGNYQLEDGMTVRKDAAKDAGKDAAAKDKAADDRQP